MEAVLFIVLVGWADLGEREKREREILCEENIIFMCVVIPAHIPLYSSNCTEALLVNVLYFRVEEAHVA